MRTCTRIRTLTIAMPLVALACGQDAYGPEEPTGPPGVAATAVIDSAGGSLEATLDGGGTVRLTLPAGAVATRDTFRIVPVVASAGALAAFRVSPAIDLRAAATLVVALPAGSQVTTTTTVARRAGTVRLPLDATVDVPGRRLTVALRRLSVEDDASAASAVSGRVRGDLVVPLAPRRQTGDAGAGFEVLDADFQERLEALVVVVNTLVASGTRDNAIAMREVADGLVGVFAERARTDGLVVAAFGEWRRVVCGQYDFALSAIGTFANPTDLAGFTRRAGDVLVWGTQAIDLAATSAVIGQPGCASFQEPLERPVLASFAPYIQTVERSLELLDPREAFDQLLTARIPALVDFEADLGATTALDTLRPRVRRLAVLQADRLRLAAYDDCVAGAQGRQRRLLLAELGVPGVQAISGYDDDDLREDVAHCGIRMRVAVRSREGSTQATALLGGVAPGQIAASTPALPRSDDSLAFFGGTLALQCPVGSANNEQLTFTATRASGGTPRVVRTVSPANDGRYFASSELAIPVVEIREAVGLEQTRGRLVIQRTGGTCNDEFPGLTHRPLATIDLQFDNALRITTTGPLLALGPASPGSCPVSEMVLEAVNGVPPLSWSVASGTLPPTYALDATSGTLRGQFCALVGSKVLFPFRSRVQSADGQSAERDLVLRICCSVGEFFVRPDSFTMFPGEVKTFAARLENGERPGPVAWSATGGSIVLDDGDGLYTAGTTPGVFSVIAISIEDASRVATAKVRIRPASEDIRGVYHGTEQRPDERPGAFALLIFEGSNGFEACRSTGEGGLQEGCLRNTDRFVLSMSGSSFVGEFLGTRLTGTVTGDQLSGRLQHLTNPRDFSTFTAIRVRKP